MGCTRQINIFAHYHSETRLGISIKWDKNAWATTAISISIKFNWNWNADWWRHQRAKCANTILVIHIYCAIYFPFICCAHGFLSLIKTFSAIAELWLSFSLSLLHFIPCLCTQFHLNAQPVSAAHAQRFNLSVLRLLKAIVY